MVKCTGLSNSVEILQFQRGDERLVINMTIPQDEICEGPQSLTAQISLYSGVHPMTMSQSTAQVFTDDCAEQECGKKEEESYTQFIYFYLYFCAVTMLAQVGCISLSPSPTSSPTPSPTTDPLPSLLYVYIFVPIGLVLLVALVVLVAAVLYVRRRRRKELVISTPEYVLQYNTNVLKCIVLYFLQV